MAALVERLTEEEVDVTLVNVHQSRERTVVVQGGAYAEHQLVDVAAGEEVTPIDHSHLAVRLAPGAGGRLTLRMRR